MTPEVALDRVKRLLGEQGEEELRTLELTISAETGKRRAEELYAAAVTSTSKALGALSKEITKGTASVEDLKSQVDELQGILDAALSTGAAQPATAGKTAMDVIHSTVDKIPGWVVGVALVALILSAGVALNATIQGFFGSAGVDSGAASGMESVIEHTPKVGGPDG